MGKLNPTSKPTTPALAGGYGARSASLGAEGELRRVVLANLLFEDLAYIDGVAVSERIAELVPQVEPERVAALAREARLKQKLRHVPLFLAVEMLKHSEHKRWVGALLPDICTRPDMLTDTLALYWQGGRKPLANQLKRGLGEALKRFDAYALAKYNRDARIRLRDVLFLTRPKPNDETQAALWRNLANDTLLPADTWEVALSGGADKRETFERLLDEGKLGALALLRNLRGMTDAGVDPAKIRRGLETARSSFLLPLNFWAAVQAAPGFVGEIEAMMLRTYAALPKLPGHTVLVLDVSGSMMSVLAGKSMLTRLNAAAALAVLAREVCESVSIFATGGDDWQCTHQTQAVPAYRGFGLADKIGAMRLELGGGGIFTQQALEYIKPRVSATTRLMVFSDSQDCDIYNTKAPQPFGEHNYIIDVSAEQHGVGFKGVWDAEISGWSEHFLSYVAALEGVTLVGDNTPTTQN